MESQRNQHGDAAEPTNPTVSKQNDSKRQDVHHHQPCQLHGIHPQIVSCPCKKILGNSMHQISQSCVPAHRYGVLSHRATGMKPCLLHNLSEFHVVNHFHR